MKRAVAFCALAAVLAGTDAQAQGQPLPPPAPQAGSAAVLEGPPPEEAPLESAPKTVSPDAALLPPPPRAPAAPAVPLKRPRADQAVVQVLDKVTAKSVRLTLDVGKTAAFESLIFTVRACESNAADEAHSEAAAYLLIDSQPASQGRKTPPKSVFKGWMYASSPSLTPFEHPIYDVWMIACKSSAPPPAPQPPTPPKPPVPAAPAKASIPPAAPTAPTAAPAPRPAAPRPAPQTTPPASAAQ